MIHWAWNTATHKKNLIQLLALIKLNEKEQKPTINSLNYDNLRCNRTHCFKTNLLAYEGANMEH